jgi:dephospho-CoA kinase
MTKIIGLTGGIGSGKTTISKYIETLGIPVYNSDDQARLIMASPAVLLSIKKEFGNEIFDNEVLIRAKLAQLVFKDPIKLQLLNQIIHPKVKADFELWLRKHKDFSFILKEAAILFESGSYKDCDCIISVNVPEDIRIQRVMLRDKANHDDVVNRIQNQWTDEMRVAKSDYVVENVDLDLAKLQVNQIISEIRNC